jgi:hypothetical protein
MLASADQALARAAAFAGEALDRVGGRAAVPAAC